MPCHTLGRLRLATFAAVSFAFPLGAQNPDSNCVHRSEFVLGNVRLAAPLGEVQQALGRPLRRHRDWNEDDGGRYEVLQLRYRNLEVDIGRRQRVERLATAAPPFGLSSGVRIGTTPADVVRRLHLQVAAEELRRDTLYLIMCSAEWGDDYGPETALLLVFRTTSAGERRLGKIELTNYAP